MKIMEVIKPSDKLEKQLLDDARKKADRILKNADNESGRILKEEMARAEKEIEELEKNGQIEIDKLINEIKAVLPLDIMRKRLEFINITMNSVLDEFFNEINKKDFADILRLSVLKVKDIFKGMKIKISCKGIDENMIKELINQSIPDVSINEISFDLQELGIVLESDDKKVTYNSTILELKSYLLENYRGELVKELFAESI
jgi:V/A-type H+-transporting ATPase subunit E